MGKRHAVRPQDVTLEAELDNYLAVPTSFHESVIEFWQVCNCVSYVEEC